MDTDHIVSAATALSLLIAAVRCRVQTWRHGHLQWKLMCSRMVRSSANAWMCCWAAVSALAKVTCKNEALCYLPKYVTSDLKAIPEPMHIWAMPGNLSYIVAPAQTKA